MQIAERDARHAAELKAQINELKEAIEQMSKHIAIRQNTPSDEEQTQVLADMEDMQNTSIHLQRGATRRLEHITALVEDSKSKESLLDEGGSAIESGGSNSRHSSILTTKSADIDITSPLLIPSNPASAFILQPGKIGSSPSMVASAKSRRPGCSRASPSPLPGIITPFPEPSLSIPEFTLSSQDFEIRLSSLLSSAFDQHMGTKKPFSEDVIVCIADLLAAVGKHQWSERPRTYLVLRIINEVKAMDDIVLDGFKDIDFPYTELTVPRCIKDIGAQRNFLQTQRYVLSERSADLVRGGRHRHLGMIKGRE
jgi:hypothetical protein